MAEHKIVKDTFGETLNVGDEVIYTYNQAFVKGNVVKFTHAGSVVVDSYPSGEYTSVNGYRRWVNKEVIKSLGRYKECVKLSPSRTLNLINSDI